jgi:hypothetical protein
MFQKKFEKITISKNNISCAKATKVLPYSTITNERINSSIMEGTHYTPARAPHPLSATIPRVKNRGTMWLYTPTRKP